MPNRNKPRNSDKALEGEGSYTATRRYNENLRKAIADKGSIARGADKARRALAGPEGAELREAERRAKRGPRTARQRAPGR